MTPLGFEWRSTKKKKKAEGQTKVKIYIFEKKKSNSLEEKGAEWQAFEERKS